MQVFELKAPNGYLVGAAVEGPEGWRFIPQVFGHRSSRKAFSSAKACVPSWARKWLAAGGTFSLKE